MSHPSLPLAVIVLAAGQGTRMKSARAKVLHEIAGFPMITHVRRVAESLNPQKIVFVVGPDTPEVAAAVEPHVTAIQKDRLGTGHAVLAAREALQGFKGRVLIMFGDSPLVRSETLQKLAEQKAPLSVLAFQPADPLRYGRVFVNAEGMVEKIVEHAEATEEERKNPLCNAGFMAFDSEVLWNLLGRIQPHNSKGEYYLTDGIELARKEGLAVAHVVGADTEVLGINSRVELAAAEAVMQTRLRQQAMENGATLQDPATVTFSADTRLGRDVVVGPHVVFGVGVEVEDDVQIHAFSHLEGVRVKKAARIGPYARLRPGAVIGEQAHIGNFVEIKKAVVETGAKINHLTYIGDAKVGARTNIGAGTITCNYDGTHKHFTEIGADVFVGSNTALVAPIKVGDGALIGAGSTVTEDVPADALAVAREKQVTKPGWAKRFKAPRKA